MDDCHVKPCFDGVMQKHAVQDVPRVGIEAERNIAHAEKRMGSGQMLFNQPDRLERFLVGEVLDLYGDRPGVGSERLVQRIKRPSGHGCDVVQARREAP